MRAADLQDPVAHSWWVPTLGWAAVALAAACVALVLYRTRRDAETVERERLARVPTSGDRFAHVRPVYLAQVDALEQRFLAGELDLRGLHQALSAVVRDFATVRRGVDARVLTLSDLRRVDGTRHLAGLIETYYRPAFAGVEGQDASPQAALDGARRVIRQW